MARKNEYGTFILSAGEIGAYTVCPEAWRLKSISRVKSIKAQSVDIGRELHEEWAKNYDEALFLAREVKLMIVLIILAGLIYFLVQLH